MSPRWPRAISRRSHRPLPDALERRTLDAGGEGGVGRAVVETGGSTVNDDDDLLFGVDDLERLKRGEQPDGWLDAQKSVLIARCRAQSADLEKLLASDDWDLVARLNKPL